MARRGILQAAPIPYYEEKKKGIGVIYVVWNDIETNNKCYDIVFFYIEISRATQVRGLENEKCDTWEVNIIGTWKIDCDWPEIWS